MNRKNAQIKFGETIGILFIVYFILMIGLLWYNSINKNDLEDLNKKKEVSIAVEKQNFLLHSPFLRSSRMFDKEDFVDIVTIRAFYNFSRTSLGKSFLRDKLGNGLVIIEVVDSDYYLESANLYLDPNFNYELKENLINLNTIEEFLVYNYSKIPKSEIRSSIQLFSLFPVLYNGKKTIGVLKIVSFSDVSI